MGRTDFDFENFDFLDFLGLKILAWAQLGPTHLNESQIKNTRWEIIKSKSALPMQGVEQMQNAQILFALLGLERSMGSNCCYDPWRVG